MSSMWGIFIYFLDMVSHGCLYNPIYFGAENGKKKFKSKTLLPSGEQAMLHCVYLHEFYITSFMMKSGE